MKTIDEAIRRAVEGDEAERVGSLLDQGADVNARDGLRGKTPLDRALECRHHRVVEILSAA